MILRCEECCFSVCVFRNYVYIAFSKITRPEKKNESLNVFQELELKSALCQTGKAGNEISLIRIKQLII